MKKRGKKGFTLVEAITATVILSFSVVVLAGIATRGLQSSKAMSVYERAWDVADRQLTIIDYIGVGKYIVQGPMEGVYEDGEIKFSWKADVSQMEDSSFLYDVKMSLLWSFGRKNQSIVVQTRLRSD